MRTTWSTGICDCCVSCDDCKTCCCAFVFPCVIIYKNVKKMDTLMIYGIPFVRDVGCLDRPSLACCMYAVGYAGAFLNVYSWSSPLVNFLEILSVFTHYNIRQTIRKDQKFDSECCCCEDFCCAIWCYSCAMSQESRHLTEIIKQSKNTNSMENVKITERDVPPL